jgi:hypothetical protein
LSTSSGKPSSHDFLKSSMSTRLAVTDPDATTENASSGPVPTRHRLLMGCCWSTWQRRRDHPATTPRCKRAVRRSRRRNLGGYDRLIGFDLSEVSIDGSQQKAPCGGEGTGPNPTDRGNCGWKWSAATDRNGTRIGWDIAGANRHDCVLLEPTLDGIDGRGLFADIDTMHLDRGYDNGVVRALCAQAASMT